jgi:hypothetical protein
MTAPKSVDVGRFLREELGSASPDLLRSMVKTFAEALMSAEADAVCGGTLRATQRRTHEPAQRLPAPGLGHPRRHGRVGDPEVAAGLVLPGLVVAAPPPR